MQSSARTFLKMRYGFSVFTQIKLTCHCKCVCFRRPVNVILNALLTRHVRVGLLPDIFCECRS